MASKKNEHMTRQESAYFKKLLLERRAVLAGDVNHLEEGALRKTKDDAATLDISNFADLGSDNFEQDFTIGLIENSEEVLREIDAAILRIENGTYGVCEESGDPIGKNRLKVVPWARLCIECQRKAELETKES
jgi:RNA polymerase-binding protein DksA